MLKLDFTLTTSKERKQFIDSYVKDKHFTQKELETIANYILYGKDENDGESVVDKKEVQIDTKYGSYKKKRPESLDELMESPGFNENNFTKTNIYKKEKPKIDRERDKDVPGIQELWKTIDHYQHLIDVSDGKVEDPTARKLTDLEKYKYKHFIIDLRRQQFLLKDTIKPVLFFGTPIHEVSGTPFSIDWDNGEDFAIKPLGLLSSNPKRFNNIFELEEHDYQYNRDAKFILDFTNPDHIYQLIEFYEDFIIAAEGHPESLLDDIMETLDFYISKAELTEPQLEILNLKKKKYPNLIIQQVLKDKYNVTHSTNYISTIYKQKVCGLIAEAAQLHYDMYMERENKGAWKKCNQCGELKLLDSRVFMRKSRSSDGYNNKCKICCKKNRKSTN